MRIGLDRITYSGGMSLRWQQGALAAGLEHYRRREFFLAHEEWESVWLTLAEPEKSFLQALIQMTAAFHHLQAGNTAGAASLLERALRRLERAPASFAGVAVNPLREEMAEWLRALQSAAAHPSAFPQIRAGEPPS